MRECPKKSGALDMPEAPLPLSRNTMSHPKTQAPPARVSVFDTSAQCPDSQQAHRKADAVSGERPAQWEDCTGGARHEQLSPFGAKVPPPLLPDTRSPYDCWHTERYLIGWLVKGHGWRVHEPGVLVKPKTQASPCSVEEEA